MYKYSIVIIEDNPVQAAFVIKTLESYSKNTVSFATGKEFIECKTLDNPDIIIIDYILPDTDGIELLKHKNKIFPQSKVLFCTANDDRDIIVKAIKSGADEFIFKGNNFDTELLQKFKKLAKEVDLLKQVQESVSELEMIQSAIENSRAAIMISDLNAKPIYCNNAFINIWGYKSKEQALNTDLKALWNDDLQHEIAGKLKETGKWEGERQAKTTTGIVPMRVNAALINNKESQKTWRLFSAIDISKERENCEKAAQLNKNYQSLIDKSPYAVVIHHQGVIAYVNNIGKEMFKLPDDYELHKENIFKYIHPDSQKAILERNKNAGKGTDISFVSIEKMIDSKGNAFPVESVAIPIFYNNKPAIQVLMKDLREIKKYEKELEKSESKYRQLFDNSPDAIFVMDKKGIFQDCNKQSTKITGYSKEEIIGNTPELFSPEYQFGKEKSQDKIIEYHQKAFSGETVVFEWDTVCKNKNRKITEVSYFTYTASNNELVCAVVKDITEKRKAEIKLAESEEKYRTYIDASPIGVFVTDQKGNYIEVNKAACNLLAYRKEELLGKNIVEIIQPDTIERAKKHFEKVLKDGFASGSSVFIKKNGDKLFGKIDAIKLSNTKMLGFVTDITKEIELQKELLTKEKQYRLLFENIHSEFILFDALKDKTGQVTSFTIIEVNEAYLKTVNVRKEDLIGKTTEDVYKENAKVFFKDMKMVAETGKSISFDYHFKNIDLHYLVKIYSPQINQVAIIFNNITELKKHQQELIKAKEKAEESDRLKSAFLANMSHEIRTPMNAILGFSNILKRRNITPEKQDDFVNIILDRGNHLLEIINDLIDISKIEAGIINIETKEINLYNFINNIKGTFVSELSGKDLNLKLSVNSNDRNIFISSDYQKLNQVLSNLLSNAIKFTQTGVVEIGYLKEESRVKIFVKDTGIGIDEEKQKEIFERFRQADESISKNYGGTGLGLSITKKLLKLLDSEIQVNSVLGKGSEFYFYMPIIKKGSFVQKKNLNKRKDLDEYNFNEKRVLLIEDDYSTYYYIESILDLTGAIVLHCTNAEQGISLLNDFEPDIILMDIQLPGLSGLEAAKIIKEDFPNIPIIAQTAFATKDKIASLKSSDFVDYILKPIDQEDLLYVMEKSLFKD